MSGPLPSEGRRSPPAGHRERAERALLEEGHYATARYEFTAHRPVVSVRDLSTGILVAYSGTGADFEDSVSEFVRDFL